MTLHTGKKINIQPINVHNNQVTHGTQHKIYTRMHLLTIQLIYYKCPSVTHLVTLSNPHGDHKLLTSTTQNLTQLRISTNASLFTLHTSVSIHSNIRSLFILANIKPKTQYNQLSLQINTTFIASKHMAKIITLHIKISIDNPLIKSKRILSINLSPEILQHRNSLISTSQTNSVLNSHTSWHLITALIVLSLLSLIHIWRCRRSTLCRSRWSPYH